MLISAFLLLAVVSGIIFTSQRRDSMKSKDSYAVLEELVKDPEDQEEIPKEEELSEEELKRLEAAAAFEKYGALMSRTETLSDGSL